MKQLLLLLLCVTSYFAANAQSVLNSDAYLAHIEKNGQKPMQYVADKIRKYSVVTIGEDHWIKDHPLFLCDVIGTMSTDTTANIDILALTQNKLLHELNEGVFYTPNIDHLVKLQHDREFYNIYRQADWVVSDSQILYWLSKLLKHSLPEAIPGSSFFPAFYNYHANDPIFIRCC